MTRSVRAMVQAALQRFRDEDGFEGEARPVLILELDPGKTAFGAGSDFWQALSLAELLCSRTMARVKTVAYIPRPIKGHGVLIAMACEEIVMAAAAEIGEAGVDLDLPESALGNQAARDNYRQIAELRRTIPAAVALGLLDKSLEVHKVETEVNLEFVLAEDLDDLRKRLTVVADEILIQRGELGAFTGREARALGFAKYLAADRTALARALGLRPESVDEDPLLGRALVPLQLNLTGPITAQLVGRVQTMITTELRDGEVNFICLRIDSPGGSLVDSLTLANHLAEIDRSAVRTVAYVANQAESDAALIALACDHLVMHADAVLGGENRETVPATDIAAARASIRHALANRGSSSWSLITALIDRDLVVFRYRHRSTGAIRYFCAEEAESQPDAGDWQQGDKITGNDQPLRVVGTRARELGLARDVVENFDGLKQLYGLEGDPRLVEPGWADFLIDALASPGVATLLLIIGGASLYAEIHAPGIGIGGFVAGVAFLLFFWSKFLDGTASWLEVMLFLGGLCFLLLEIFVIPGFGIFGLGGGLMIVSALVLASQTFMIPPTRGQLQQLPRSILVVAGAALGIVAAAALMRRYASRTPMLSRLLLQPMPPPEAADLSRREALTDFGHLLSARGVTTTRLVPSGKARFGSELIDVIADGEVIDRGRAVVVVDVRGNHVRVQQASPPDSGEESNGGRTAPGPPAVPPVS